MKRIKFDKLCKAKGGDKENYLDMILFKIVIISNKSYKIKSNRDALVKTCNGKCFIIYNTK